MWKIAFCLLTIASSVSNTKACFLHVAKSITCLSTLLNCHSDHLLALLKKCHCFNQWDGNLTSVQNTSITHKIQSRISKVNHSGKLHSRFLVLISPLSQCTFIVCCESHLNKIRGHPSIEHLSTCIALGTCKNLISSELQIYKLHFLFIKVKEAQIS